MKHRLLLALALLLALPAPRLAAQSSTVPLKSPVQKVNTAGATQGDVDTGFNLTASTPVVVKSGATLTNNGTIANAGTLSTTGNLTIASGGTLNAVAGSNIILAGTTTLNGAISGNAVLGIAQGGTARTTLTTDSILTGNTTGAVKSSEVYASSAYTVVALGDSITQLGSYPTRLGSLLGSGWQVLNEGITGQTTTAIAARVATSATERSTAAYVIVAAGINDVAQGVSAGTIQTNLQAIYTALSGAGKTVITLNIPPFGNNADWTSGKQAVLETVNTWIASTATGITHKVNIYNLLTGGSGDDLIPAYDSGDGLHPNTAGGNAIGDLIHSTVGTWTSALGLDARLRFGTPDLDLLWRGGTGAMGTGARWLFGNTTEVGTGIGSAAVDIRGGLSVAKAVRIAGNTTISGIVRLGNGTAAGNVTSGDLVAPGGAGFGGNIWGGGYLAVAGSITSTTNSTITGGAFVSNATNGVFTNTSAGTDARYLRLATTGGDVWLGIESSSAGVGFTGAAAYESVLYSPNNNVYVRTPSFKVAGTLVAGSGPTTLTDSAGKVLSAALNTVGAAQGGTGLAAHTTNGLLQATGSTTLQSTLTPAGITSIGVNSIASAAATDLALSAGSDLTRYTGSLPKFRVAASGSGAFGLYFTTGTTAEGDVRFDNSTYSLHLNAGRSSGWGGEIVMTADAAETLRLTETSATFAVPAKFSSTTGAGYIEIAEQSSSPAAPAANVLRVYAQDNGSGKTRIIIRTSSGTEHVLWTEP